MDILGIVCMLITPVVFLIIGIVFSIHPSKQINDYSGHRTKLSKKNQESWDLAQKLMAKAYLILGLFFTLLSVAIAVFLIVSKITGGALWIVVAIMLVLQCLCPAFEYVYVEKALKKL